MRFINTVLPVLAAAAVLASPGVGRGQTTYTWVGDGTSPNWNVPANWSGGSGLNTHPGANGSTTDTVVFADSTAAGFATTIAGGLTIADLTVTRNAAWSVNNVGALRVTNGPTVTTGALLVNNNLLSPAPIAVPAGGTLGGGGAILSGPITVAGTLSPGGIAGATLTQTTARLTTLDIAFAPGSTFEVGLGASGNDLLDAGDLTFGSLTTLRLVNNGFDATTARAFDIANYTGAAPNLGNVFIDDSAYAGMGDFSLSIGIGQVVVLNFTPVPEPGTVLGVGAGALALGGFVRRKWRKPACVEPAVA